MGVTYEIQYETVPSHIYFKKVELENVSTEEHICTPNLLCQEINPLNYTINYNELIIRNSKINTVKRNPIFKTNNVPASTLAFD